MRSLLILLLVGVEKLVSHNFSTPHKRLYQEINGKVRIINGKDAERSDAPFMVRILAEEPRVRYLCGGSLIDPHTVITAAHCMVEKISSGGINKTAIYHPSYIKVTAGDVRTSKKEKDEISKTPTSIFIHPMYSMSSLRHDIAVLHFSNPFPFGRSISSIDLPTAEIPQGDSVNVAGWGQINDQELSDSLQILKYRVITRANCRQWYPGITYNHICTGLDGYKLHSGRGDSGGPIFTTTKSGTFELVGIVSYGVPTKNLGFYNYDVNTNVYAYTSFIRSAQKNPLRNRNVYNAGVTAEDKVFFLGKDNYLYSHIVIYPSAAAKKSGLNYVKVRLSTLTLPSLPGYPLTTVQIRDGSNARYSTLLAQIHHEDTVNDDYKNAEYTSSVPDQPLSIYVKGSQNKYVEIVLGITLSATNKPNYDTRNYLFCGNYGTMCHDHLRCYDDNMTCTAGYHHVCWDGSDACRSRATGGLNRSSQIILMLSCLYFMLERME